MNTIVHIAGIIASVWLAYAFFVPLGAQDSAGEPFVPFHNALGYICIIFTLYLALSLFITTVYDARNPMGKNGD